MSFPSYFAHRWLGSEAPHLDAPHLSLCGNMVVGAYGGSTLAGANKNEDGAFALSAADGGWHFAALCDAHVSSDSVELVLQTLELEQAAIVAALSLPAPSALPALHHLIVTLFGADDFRAKCQALRGETACLLCAQKDQWLWWLSIGDCALYLFHPELARLGQFALNQRNFYEWVGQVNTFDLAIPCFASGVRELRQGWNSILMATDGLLECGTRPFEDARVLYDLLMERGEEVDLTQQERVGKALARVHQENGRDSATIIQWGYASAFPCAYPTG